MKILLLIVFLFSILGFGDAAAAYRSSLNKDGIPLSPEWKTIREWECPEDGTYLIVYNAHAINNETYNVMVVFEMRLGDQILDTSGYNISSDNHYGEFPMNWVGEIYRGEVVEIRARANSSAGMNYWSVILPYEYGRRKWESLSIIRVNDYWHQGEPLTK